ncbi:hypothetical protein IFM89_019939 [Coptis chinensis]|uniref:Uncharacterized protein n=1 Tax=Coptis chinensis TaxID=261450 RepID=A0A835I3Z6_9MAGN|nr:hypothetical protein IFM89_019939 [Coptis chinensis]
MEFLIGAQVESRGRDYRTSIGGGNWFKIAWHGQCQGGLLREDLWMYKPSPQFWNGQFKGTMLDLWEGCLDGIPGTDRYYADSVLS